MTRYDQKERTLLMTGWYERARSNIIAAINLGPMRTATPPHLGNLEAKRSLSVVIIISSFTMAISIISISVIMVQMMMMQMATFQEDSS